MPMLTDERDLPRINDGSLLTLEGTYTVYVQIQDGIEYLGNFGNKPDARRAWVDGHKFFNHTDRDPKEMPSYVVEEVTYLIAVPVDRRKG